MTNKLTVMTLDTDYKCVYYSDMPVGIGDIVNITTKHGCCLAAVTDIEPAYNRPSNYVQEVIENVTRGISTLRRPPLPKVVGVKHMSTGIVSLVCTDLDLTYGDVVVFEAPGSHGQDSLRVGIVNTLHTRATASLFCVVDLVDARSYKERSSHYNAPQQQPSAARQARVKEVEAHNLSMKDPNGCQPKWHPKSERIEGREIAYLVTGGRSAGTTDAIIQQVCEMVRRGTLKDIRIGR